MIKKTLNIILLAMLLALPAAAQQKTGSWTVYPLVSSDYTNIIEADGTTWMLGNGRLSSYDGTEYYSFSSANRLSESTPITNIYYNYDRKILIVAYQNGNMDAIYADGRVRNLPEIKDAVVTSGTGINHVDFSGDLMVVATEFGIVLYDLNKCEVRESTILNKNVESAFVTPTHLLYIQLPMLYYSPLEGRHNTADKFDVLRDNLYGVNVIKIAEDCLLYTHRDQKKPYRLKLDLANGTSTPALLSEALPTGIPQRLGDGAFMYNASSYFYVSADGSIVSEGIPAALRNSPAFGTSTAKREVWVSKTDGLGKYDVTTPSAVRTLVDPFSPEGFTVSLPSTMKVSADGNRIYVSNVSATYGGYGPTDDGFDVPQTIDIISGGRVYDAAVHLNMNPWSSPDHDVSSKDRTRIAATTGFVPDPDDPSVYYHGSNRAGVYVIRDGVVQGVYNKSNSLISNGKWLNRVMDVNIDRHGNLWMCSGYESDYDYMVLPAAKRLKPSEVTQSDWKFAKKGLPGGGWMERDARSIACRHSRFFIYHGGRYGSALVCYDDNNTSMNMADDRVMAHETFTDTEGNNIFYPYLRCISEDRNGAIWVGTSQGLFVVNDPEELMSPALRVKRPIVARNDGTNFGDYLLDAQDILAISVDPSNRKWIATATSGVYLVSPDGTEIVRHYDTSNSPLLSDCVYSVCADPTSNKVYFGTLHGVVGFDSDSAPAADDYSDVYAFPNPVRPDYDGWITVTGLMDGSLVKIADMAGNVFFQGRSEGGMISWDGCRPDGQRVQAGVYLIFASKGSEGSADGVVAKLMVIN